MAIVGIGADVVDTERIRAIWGRHGQRFAQRILTLAERAEWNGLEVGFLARRFAVKEAAAKALGSGIAAGVTFRDMELGHDHRGRPLLHFTGAAWQRSRVLGVTSVHVSISDERTLALAFVILESQPL
ncbi:holo-ACP synthase [Nitrococcus mobilis]|uniref:Holo-[acyl-carrier-protein] synthase n=1 Tax=Nitrococcus mobilis Nb-231 TaxID=314278 RepID=A4BRZ8_9GAMM|nr:4'-phosphopantetheinyl transferase [Nitrococcus mobilis Nb-231]